MPEIGLSGSMRGGWIVARSRALWRGSSGPSKDRELNSLPSAYSASLFEGL